jgi:lipopolysaccharide export system protein LptA
MVRNWQTRARAVLAVFTVGFAIVVYFAIGSREEARTPDPGERRDPAALIETSGAIVTQAKGSKQDFRIEAQRQLTYEGGAMKLEAVKVTVQERAGRDFEVTGRQAEVAQDQARIAFEGDVRLAASDGFTARTEQATYDNGGSLLTIPGPLEFARGRLTGTGRGGSYDRARDVMRLDRDAVVRFGPDSNGGGAIDIRSTTATLARREGYLRFEENVRIERPNQVIEASLAVAYFGADDSRIDMIELRDGARVTGGGPEPGVLQGMTARDIDLIYAEDGQTLSQMVLTGNGAVDVAGANGGAGRRIAAESLHVTFTSDGATMDGLTARDQVQLDFAGGGQQMARRITANAMDGVGQGQGITTVRLSENVEFRESKPAARGVPAVERIARSRVLELVVQPGLGAVTQAHFSGDFTFREHRLEAAAPDAVYQIEKEAVALRAPVAGSGRPSVNDDGTAIEAARIDLTLQGRELVADGDVRTVSQPSSGASGDAAAGREEARRPAMLKEDAPVYVTARHLEYQGQARNAVYTGEARLWQGRTAIQAGRLVLDQESGNFTATGAARSTLLFEQKTPDGSGTETFASVASADELVYDDGLRRATYSAAVPPTKEALPVLAHVSGPQGDLRAEKIELYLDRSGAGLDRVEAYGKVTLQVDAPPAASGGAPPEAAGGKPPRSRLVTGQRMTYFAEAGRYLMSGTPVSILEECRETLGKSLTFFRSADTISVDGNEEIRTQSKAGGNCPEPQK